MNISTLIALFVIIVLGILAIKMLMGFARMALKVAIVVVVAYLAFSIMSDAGLTHTPTGAEVNEVGDLNDTLPAPTVEGPAALQAEADSQHPTHYT